MRPILVFVCLLFVVSVYSQDYFIIIGKVVDSNNAKPLPYAHVGIPEKGIGTTTGMDGGFTLKVPSQYNNSTLLVSYVGYTTYRKAINTINDFITIRVKASPTDLQEIIVMDEAGVENIIRKAVKAIPKNYPTHPITNLAFYRESRTDDQEEHIYLAEGVLNVYKTSYRNDNEGQVSLVQGRKVILQPEALSNSVGFTSGHLAAHRFDFVKNRENFIEEKNFPDYAYWVEKITTYQDLPVYVIGFDKAEEGKGRLKGRVYIDTSSYAFLRAEFEIRPEGLKKYDDYPLYAGNWKGNTYTVNYRKIGDKWYFGDALREGIYRDGGLYSNEVIITEINTDRSGPLPYLDRLDRNDAFLRVTGTYDEDFWKQYNTTPLSQKLTESLVQAKNEAKSAEVFDSTYMAEVQRLQDSIKTVTSQSRTGDIRMSEDFNFNLDNYNLPIRRQRKFRWQWQLAAGVGLHLLETEAANMSLSYLNSDEGQTILNTSKNLKARAFEPIYHGDLRIVFRKNFFFTWSFSRDLWDSHYRERTLGLGTQFNISKYRPMYLRMGVHESRLRYARLIGKADNEAGTFKVDKKKFNSEQVNMYYGNQTHNLKLTLEWALELNPSRELFVRGGYMLPYSTRQHLYLRERKDFFNKRVRIPTSDRTIVLRNDAPFDDPITPDQSFFITLGMVFK
ncbi:MAG: carboxypeptidase-like regulatory domain-containing protein [Saprospiraceae bacterium]|nr:carboxypeptidase-like regulatory domain-containing protein [Saprospiraceae bacterium]